VRLGCALALLVLGLAACSRASNTTPSRPCARMGAPVNHPILACAGTGAPVNHPSLACAKLGAPVKLFPSLMTKPRVRRKWQKRV